MKKIVLHTIILLAFILPMLSSAYIGDKNKKLGDDKKRKKEDTTQVINTSAIA